MFNHVNCRVTDALKMPIAAGNYIVLNTNVLNHVYLGTATALMMGIAAGH